MTGQNAPDRSERRVTVVPNGPVLVEGPVELVTEPSYALDLGRPEGLRRVAGERGPRGALELDIR